MDGKSEEEREIDTLTGQYYQLLAAISEANPKALALRKKLLCLNRRPVINVATTLVEPTPSVRPPSDKPLTNEETEAFFTPTDKNLLSEMKSPCREIK